MLWLSWFFRQFEISISHITGEWAYKLRYVYKGRDGPNLCPNYICTDSIGHVLVADISNNRIHILDKDGKFLQYLLTKKRGLRLPFSIDIDKDDRAWITELIGKGDVKIVKYLEWFSKTKRR